MSIAASIAIWIVIAVIGHEIARRREAREWAEHYEEQAKLRERLGR